MTVRIRSIDVRASIQPEEPPCDAPQAQPELDLEAFRGEILAAVEDLINRKTAREARR